MALQRRIHNDARVRSVHVQKRDRHLELEVLENTTEVFKLPEEMTGNSEPQYLLLIILYSIYSYVYTRCITIYSTVQYIPVYIVNYVDIARIFYFKNNADTDRQDTMDSTP